MKEEINRNNENNIFLKNLNNNILAKSNSEPLFNINNRIKNIKTKEIFNHENNTMSFDNTGNKYNNNNDIKINYFHNIKNISNNHNTTYQKINEYFNNNSNYEQINRFYMENYLKYLCLKNYNQKIEQLNLMNNNYNFPNHNYPNIITNNNNYYYSYNSNLDNFPINVPIYINNLLSDINIKDKNNPYDINIIHNSIQNNIKNNINNNMDNNNTFFRNNNLNKNGIFVKNLNNSNYMREYNFNVSNDLYMNNYYNNLLLPKKNNFRDYSSDFAINRFKFIKNRVLSLNNMNNQKPLFAFPFFRKRAYSHEKPFSLIQKYYDKNLIMEEENEEDNNTGIKEKNDTSSRTNEQSIYLDQNLKENIENYHQYTVNKKILYNNNNILNNQIQMENKEYYRFNNLKLLELNNTYNYMNIKNIDNTINSYRNNNNSKLINVFHNNDINLFQKYNKVDYFNSHLSPKNLVYERKNIHKKFIISKSPNTKEKNDSKKDLNNNNNVTKNVDKTNNNKENILKRYMNKKEKNKFNINTLNNNIINEIAIINEKKYKNENDDENKINDRKENTTKREKEKKFESQNKIIKKINNKRNKREIFEKKMKRILNTYIYNNNTLPTQNKMFNNKTKNDTSKNRKSQKILNNISNTNINTNLNTNLNTDYIKYQSNNNENEKFLNTEKKRNKNRVIFNKMKIINLDNHKKSPKKKFQLNIEKNKFLENSYDNIFSKKIFKKVPSYKRIHKTFSINTLSKTKTNFSVDRKIHNLSEEKKYYKTTRTINCSNNKNLIIRISPLKKTNDKEYTLRNKILTNKNLNNSIKNKNTGNVNKIKLDLNVNKRKRNVINNNEISYTKQYIKKVKSKEHKKNKEIKTQKTSQKNTRIINQQKIDLNNINCKSLKNSLKNIDINKYSYKKNKINENSNCQTLNNKTINRSPLRIKNKNLIFINSNITNPSEKIKPKRKSFRVSLLNINNLTNDNITTIKNKNSQNEKGLKSMKNINIF